MPKYGRFKYGTRKYGIWRPQTNSRSVVLHSTVTLLKPIGTKLANKNFRIKTNNQAITFINAFVSIPHTHTIINIVHTDFSEGSIVGDLQIINGKIKGRE